MTRNTAKNPMTKTVYGSGVKGVADGIAMDMMLGFYEQLQKVPGGQSLEEALGYPGIEQDLEMLFGIERIDLTKLNEFEFP